MEFIPLFFISLTIHEFAHAYAAFKKGDPTAKAHGRMTLNPLKHIDLVGSLLMPFISYFTGSMFIGWAKPTPVNRQNFMNPRKDDIIVSAAGPLSNLLLALICAFIMQGIVRIFPQSESILKLLWLCITFNVFLFLFNLLPIPPLDGSHIIRNLFPNSIFARIAISPLFGTIILFMFIFSPLWKYFIALIEVILKLFALIIV